MHNFSFDNPNISYRLSKVARYQRLPERVRCVEGQEKVVRCWLSTSSVESGEVSPLLQDRR